MVKDCDWCGCPNEDHLIFCGACGCMVTNHGETMVECSDLHPKIKEASEVLFRDTHFSSCVLEAYKALESHVKQKSGREDLSGKSLMSEVFSPRDPVLALNALRSESDRDEQEGFMLLFMGAMVGVRNPRAHGIVEERDAYSTMEYLMLASMLAKRVDESRKLR
jgi:uncharacterized protein (TIGR02391 family)